MSPVRRPVALGTVALLVLGGLSAAMATPDPTTSSEVVGGPVVLAERPQPALPAPALRRRTAEVSTAPPLAVISPAVTPAAAPEVAPAVAPAVVRSEVSVQVTVVEAVTRTATVPVQSAAREISGAAAVQASSPRHATTKAPSADGDERERLDARIEARADARANARRAVGADAPAGDRSARRWSDDQVPLVAAVSVKTAEPSVETQGPSVEARESVAVGQAVVASTVPAQVQAHQTDAQGRLTAHHEQLRPALAHTSGKHESAKASPTSGGQDSSRHRSELGPRGR